MHLEPKWPLLPKLNRYKLVQNRVKVTFDHRRKYIRHIFCLWYSDFLRRCNNPYIGANMHILTDFNSCWAFLKESDYFLQINHLSNKFRDAPRALWWFTFQRCSHGDETIHHKRLSYGWKNIWHNSNTEKITRFQNYLGWCYFALLFCSSPFVLWHWLEFGGVMVEFEYNYRIASLRLSDALYHQ